MSPRAAWRLEAAGFSPVYEYAAGKADWLAADLPFEGTAELAGMFTRRGVATVGERTGKVALHRAAGRGRGPAAQQASGAVVVAMQQRAGRALAIDLARRAGAVAVDEADLRIATVGLKAVRHRLAVEPALRRRGAVEQRAGVAGVARHVAARAVALHRVARRGRPREVDGLAGAHTRIVATTCGEHRDERDDGLHPGNVSKRAAAGR